MKKVLKLVMAAATLLTLASCGNNAGKKEYEGYAVGVGFSSHGDVAFANVKVNGNKKIVDVEVKEVFGIRSVGNIVNNRTYNDDGSEKTAQADIDKCEAIAAENKVVSEITGGKNYESYKYLLVGEKLLICETAGAAPVYNEDKTDGLKDVNALLKDNTKKDVMNWWVDALKANNVKFLKVAGEGDTVVTTASDSTKLAVMKDGFDSFYGPSIYKADNYTSKVPTYAASFVNFNTYVKEHGVDIDVTSSDFTTACTLQQSANYLAVAKDAYNNAVAKIGA